MRDSTSNRPIRLLNIEPFRICFIRRTTVKGTIYKVIFYCSQIRERKVVAFIYPPTLYTTQDDILCSNKKMKRPFSEIINRLS